MNEKKKELSVYLENICLGIIGAFFVIFPLLFLSTTTDAFILPKQILLTIVTAVVVILFGLRAVADGRLKLRNSPFDVPVIIFLVVCFASAIFSLNRADAFIAFVPLLFITLLYFVIVNIIRTEKQLFFALSTLVLGGSIAALFSILTFAKLYALPFSYTHVPYFNTFGSLLDQAIYFALLLPINGYFAYTYFMSLSSAKQPNSPSPFYTKSRSQKTGNQQQVLFSISFVVVLIALGITAYQLFFVPTQKIVLLPYDMGVRIGLSAISQDTNLLKSFLLGSGIGTFLNDFTRFKPINFNLSNELWSFTFLRSSSYLLELLATTGILGFASFLFLIYRVLKERNFFLPLVLACIAALVLPFSFTLVALFFIFLSIFAVVRIHNNPERFSEMELYMVTLKRGLLRVLPEGDHIPQNQTEKRYGKFLPWVFFVVIIATIGIPMFFAGKFIVSDFVFQKSLVTYAQNKGSETYKLQTDAWNIFPYRDIYYRAYSQTNLALANSLASQKSSTPSAETQKTIVSLIQQGITAGRSAATIAPLTAYNWNNLSSVYRSLIGFGQNADQFTIITLQQAIVLDPNNPQQYVELGGIYYQLGNYDEAIRNFQTAIKLKPDYGNAYYNLGHSFESKGDLNTALAAYQTVKQLVSKDAQNSTKVSAEIEALMKKIKDAKDQKQKTASSTKEVIPSEEQAKEPLDVNKPATTLPEANPKVKIPGPTVSPAASKEEANSTDTTPAPTAAPTVTE